MLRWNTINRPAEYHDEALTRLFNPAPLDAGQGALSILTTSDGDISLSITFDDISPTGLEVSASTKTIYLTEADAVPHLPENGKLMAFEPGSSTATEVASGAPLLIDVQYSSDDALFAFAQGYFPRPRRR